MGSVHLGTRSLAGTQPKLPFSWRMSLAHTHLPDGNSGDLSSELTRFAETSSHPVSVSRLLYLFTHSPAALDLHPLLTPISRWPPHLSSRNGIGPREPQKTVGMTQHRMWQTNHHPTHPRPHPCGTSPPQMRPPQAPRRLTANDTTSPGPAASCLDTVQPTTDIDDSLAGRSSHPAPACATSRTTRSSAA